MIVGIIEADLNRIDATRFGSYFLRYPPVKLLTHTNEGRVCTGIVTGHKYNKLRYARDLISFIEDGKIGFASDMVYTTANDTESERVKMMEKAKEQLRVFALLEQAPARPGFQELKVTTSGKHRGPDDIAIAIQMAVHFSGVCALDTEFNQLLDSGCRSIVCP